MKTFLFRLSLKAKGQRDAFERLKSDGSEFSREEWLRAVFSKQFSFRHKGNEFFFVPEPTKNSGLPEKIVSGWIARDRQQTERTPPWEGLSPTEHRSWQAALLLLDPSDHPDGQKLALESNPDVGGPAPILASLAQHFSEGHSEPYSVSVFPIIQARSFARFAEEHKGTIQVIAYDVAVPNMFNSPDDFSEEMKRLRDKGNIARVRTRLESDDAIDTDASQLDEIAEHVEKGGGKITARTKDGKRYRSDDHKVAEEIDTAGTEPETASYWETIKGALDRIF
ncbi:hypothetical protein [Mesorhizobium sp. CAU 1741]|uniref:hypothetical protein n=1 Tax=Mesorhizobium sp. CAU 1741 TaxID=3140366 RepID=UPI00325AD4FA